MRILLSFALSLLLIPCPAFCNEPEAQPTFHCIGLYWSPDSGSEANACSLKYRARGEAAWHDGYPLWYDSRTITGRPAEYRGSLVNLKPGTGYEIQLSLKDGKTAELKSATWNEKFPVGKTMKLPARSTNTLKVTVGGSGGQYRLYRPAGKKAVIDVRGKLPVCVEVTASYVILRGLTLKNAAVHGLRLGPGVHHVVVEDCDISGWGSLASDGWGNDYDSAIYSDSGDNHHFVVQRNLLHDPRSNSNSWNEPRPSKGGNPHPVGPQGVTFYADYSKSLKLWAKQEATGWDGSAERFASNPPDPMALNQGHHVIRYNEIRGGVGHYFNDGLGGGENCSFDGFPGRDSDVYGNRISHCWDNPLETEGGCMNVRVWGNYLEDSYSAVACAPVSVGPAYFWRNVSNRSRKGPAGSTDLDARGRLLKSKPCGDFDGGRICFFHNTSLQEPPPAGSSLPLGVAGGAEGSSNLISRNNILQVCSPEGLSVKDISANDGRPWSSDYDYDLFNGITKSARTQESHGLRGIPAYVRGAGLVPALAPGSAGLDQGQLLPNFNDDFLGSGPDMGARESGSAQPRYGPSARN